MTQGLEQRICHARFGFDGRTVIVTGAGTGIGQAIARAFLQEGANVVAVGRTAETLAETLGEHFGGRGVAVVADVTTRRGNDAAVSAAVAAFGGLDVFVPNAGAFFPGEIQSTSEEEWSEMQRVNVDAVFHGVRAARDALVERTGSIVAISSVSGLRGDWRQAAYNATKGAVNTLVKSLALDLGAHGVRVNAVAPAYTLTRMAPFTTPDELAPYVDRFPLRRVGAVEDIARATVFLAGPDAGFVTGVILPVDGGLTAATGHPHLGG